MRKFRYNQHKPSRIVLTFFHCQAIRLSLFTDASERLHAIFTSNVFMEASSERVVLHIICTTPGIDAVMTITNRPIDIEHTHVFADETDTNLRKP